MMQVSMMTKELLAKNLHALRKEKGLTQSQLAEDAGVSSRMIQHIEYGQSWPSDAVLGKLAAALGVDVSRLFSAPPAAPTDHLSEINSRLDRIEKALRSQIETMQPKSKDGAGRHQTGVYQYTPDTIVSKSQPAKPQETQPQLSDRDRALLEAFQSADEETRQTIEIGLGLREYHPEIETASQETSKHKNKA